MAHYVYILHSTSIDKFYVGKSGDAQKRLEYHNSSSNKIWTKRGQPWVIKAVFTFETNGEATKVERFIKRQKSRDFIDKIIRDGWKG